MINGITNILLTSPILLETPPGSILHFDKAFLYEVGIQWINVIILTFILTKILYKPVRRFMSNRTERIQNQVIEAKNVEDQAIALRKEYEDRIIHIEEERLEIMNEAQKSAREKREEIIKAARKDADEIYNSTLAEIEIERKNREKETRRQLIELSSLIAGQIVEVSIDQNVQEKLVDDALAGWEEDLWRS